MRRAKKSAMMLINSDGDIVATVNNTFMNAIYVNASTIVRQYFQLFSTVLQSVGKRGN